MPGGFIAKFRITSARLRRLNPLPPLMIRFGLRLDRGSSVPATALAGSGAREATVFASRLRELSPPNPGG